MATDRARRMQAAVATLALASALAGCTDAGQRGSATPSDPATATQGTDGTPTPTESGEAPPATDGETPEPIPADFPDPQTLVGQEAYDEQAPDGSWHTVVGGEPLDLVLVLGSCFEGGTGEVCGYSISGSVPGPAGPDGTPAPSDAALLLLLRSTGTSADGTPTWLVLDAALPRPPEPPAVLQLCDGEDGVAFYPADDVGDVETVPVAAAWGPNGDVTALVELDPAEVTCAYVGP